MFRKLFLSFLFTAFMAAPALAEKTYIVAADAMWPPMETLDSDKNVVGFSIDFLKAVGKEAGLEFEFRNTAWDGIFAALGSNQADVISSSVTITDKRKKAMAFSDPYYVIKQAVIVPIDSTISKMADLDGKKVGGQIGTTGLIQALPLAKSTAIPKSYDDVGLAIEDLAKGNLDAVICDDPVAMYYANKKEEYNDLFKIAFITEDEEFFGYALRKNDTELLEKINAGIKAVKEKGLDKPIMAKWLGE